MSGAVYWRALVVSLALCIGVLFAIPACGSEDGDDGNKDGADVAAETGSPEVGDTDSPEAADDTLPGDSADDVLLGDAEDAADGGEPEDSEAEVQGKPSIEESGCVTCHTDKDAMVALAPTEEVQEASGGG